MDHLITISAAAELLGVEPRTVRYHVTAGHLGAVAVTPRLYLLDRREVEKFRPAPRGPAPRRKNHVSHVGKKGK